MLFTYLLLFSQMMKWIGVFLSFLVLGISTVSGCDRCVHHSKAAYFGSPSAHSVGACGYGSLAMTFDGGYLAAGTSKLFRNGVGCGACFQIRCKNTAICSSTGVKIVVVDLNASNKTDFILAKKALSAMANKGMGRQVLDLGIVDIEYRRIPCEYKNHNLSLRIEENSDRSNNYLAIKFLYQGGQTDISSVDVARLGTSDWKYLLRDYGAVWSTSQAPTGPLQFRMVVTGGYDGKWVWTNKEVLPADSKNGVVYDSGVQITDIAQQNCYPCNNSAW